MIVIIGWLCFLLRVGSVLICLGVGVYLLRCVSVKLLWISRFMSVLSV